MRMQRYTNVPPLLQPASQKAVNYMKCAWMSSELLLCLKSASGLLILLTNKIHKETQQLFICNSQGYFTFSNL